MIGLVTDRRWIDMAMRNLLDAVSRYDLVLAVIPTAFISAILAANLLSIPASNALIIASFVGTLALVDALFLNPPTRPENGP